MPLPVLTPALARRIDGVIVAQGVDQMRRVQARPGNPLGVQIQAFGSATAYLVQSAGNGWWNRVGGLDTDDAATLDQIVAFYRDHGVEPNIDLDPSRFTTALHRHLAARGLSLDHVDTVLYGTPELMSPPGRAEGNEGFVIHAVGKDQVDLVTRLWADGFQVPPASRDFMMTIRRGSFESPANHLYVAYVDGQPAAMSALLVQDGIGYLNVGATLPPYRRLGIHRAMSERRVQDARDWGCELLMGFVAGFGKTSQNNMERRGLRVAYNRLTWAV